MGLIAARLNRIKQTPVSMAAQRARALRAAGRDIIGLTYGEPDFDTPSNVCDAVVRAMAASKTKYTDVGGTPELRAAIIEKFRRDNGLVYALDEVVVGTGGKQIIFGALMCTLEPEDEVIVPAPYWASYPDITLLAEGRPVFVTCRPDDGFKLRPEALDRAITPKTRWLVLNAPSNPSGATYTREELRLLADVLLRHPHVWIMTDDIYEHILYDDRRFFTIAEVEPALKERTLTVNGVSKAYAMTGWRIGYGGAPAELVKAMVKLQSQSTSNPCSISQAAAEEALTGPQDVIAERTRIFEARRDMVVAAVNEIPGLRCHAPEGAFYVYASCAGVIGRKTPDGKVLASDADFVMYLLESQNLALLQGEAYGLSPFVRISFAASMQILETGCQRLRLACEALR